MLSQRLSLTSHSERSSPCIVQSKIRSVLRFPPFAMAHQNPFRVTDLHFHDDVEDDDDIDGHQVYVACEVQKRQLTDCRKI